VIVLAAALLVGAAIVWAARVIRNEMAAVRADAARVRALAILNTFAPAVAASQGNPRAILAWQPVARAARALFAEEFAAIDRALGAPFPYSPAHVQAAHAQWTADWLAWERAHDADYKMKAAAAEVETRGDASSGARARLDAIEREKLELYQRRYEEYIRVAKALQSVQM